MYVLELAGENDRFATREAASRGADVSLIAAGLATAERIHYPESLAYTRRVCSMIDTCQATIDAAVAVLDASDLEVAGSVAVRARDIRGTTNVDTQLAERRIGQILVDRGMTVDLDTPDHTLVVLFSEPTSVLGWLEIEPTRTFTARQPTAKPFFQPGSIDPMDARALANMCGARPDSRVLDPMCGTGGILVEAGLSGAITVGVDAQAQMVQGARENLTNYLEDEYTLIQGDATRLPFTDDSFDGVVFDTPYGRQSKIEGSSRQALIEGALAESRRITETAVVVCDHPVDTAATEAGWTVESRFDRRVHRSLTRYIHVLQ